MGRKVNKNRGDAFKKVKMVSLSKKLKLDQRNNAIEKKKKAKIEELQVAKKRASQMKRFKWRYHHTQQILLVGEGNCSFARALVRQFKKNLYDIYTKRKLPLPRDPYLESLKEEMDIEMSEEMEEDMEDMEDMEDFEMEEDELIDEDDEEMEDEFQTSGYHKKKIDFTFKDVARNLLVTCYDTQEVAMSKYDDLPEILSELLAAGARVVFGIDASTLHSTLSNANLVPDSRFDRVVFNFPHVGLGIKDKQENIEVNQRLILAFLANALPLLRKPNTGLQHSPFDADEEETEKSEKSETEKDTKGEYKPWKGKDQGGEAHITIKEGEPYSLWRLPVLARTLNLNQMNSQKAKEEATERAPGSLDSRFPKLMLTSSHPFFFEKYDGYEHRRTLGFKRGLTLDSNLELKNGARTYTFTRAPKNYLDAGLGLHGDPDEKNTKIGGKVGAPKSRKKKSGRVLKRGKRGKINKV